MADLPGHRRGLAGLRQALRRAFRRLRHAQFFGRFERRCDVAGFSLVRLHATTPAHQVVLHVHEDGHFILVLAGRYRSSARGAEAILGPGDLLWNPPGTHHQDCFSSAEGRFLSLSLPARQAQELGLGDQGARRLLGLTERPGRSLVRHAEALDLGDLLDTEVQCLSLCALTAGETAPEIRDQRVPPWLRRCMERLVDESGQALRLGDLAREAGVHPVSLARAFRRHYGLSPGQLQRRSQLNRASALLSRGESIGEVASACGFADQSHFTRLFRAEYRSTPARWQTGFKTF